MRLSQGVEWAAHACTLLSALGQGQGLSLAALAEFHGVPAAYMAKQMQLLSKAGLVRTSRGKTGGYALARPAGEITLWDVARAIDGAAPLFRCSEIRQRGPCAARRQDCKRPCSIAAAFAQAETAWRESLDQVTIAQIAMQVATGSAPEHIVEGMRWLGANITALPDR
jgi:Rrf2 family protein